jgi:hypothetical protein
MGEVRLVKLPAKMAVLALHYFWHTSVCTFFPIPLYLPPQPCCAPYWWTVGGFIGFIMSLTRVIIHPGQPRIDRKKEKEPGMTICAPLHLKI